VSPRPLFDEIIHERTRLRLSGMLAAVVEAEFATLREALGVSESALSKHVRALEEAGYVAVRKVRDGSRTFTIVAMTDTGRHAFCGHVAEIQRLAGVASMRPGRRPAPHSVSQQAPVALTRRQR
jgi:DNA-binding transcriptional ArsR family regulator